MMGRGGEEAFQTTDKGVSEELKEGVYRGHAHLMLAAAAVAAWWTCRTKPILRSGTTIGSISMWHHSGCRRPKLSRPSICWFVWVWVWVWV